MGLILMKEDMNWQVMHRKNKQTFTIEGKVTAVLKDAKTGKIKQMDISKNIIVNVGLTAILNRLGNEGVKANEGIMTYGAVSDGSLNPALTDTIMENEIDRKLIGVTTVSGQTLTVETFYAEAEAIGDLTKFALFGEEATVSADTGTMFEYVKFNSAINKTGSDTLTVTSEITIANA
jgi:hypothetical protein